MDVVTGAVSAAVVPTADATGRLRALDAASVTIRGGFWADQPYRDEAVAAGGESGPGPAAIEVHAIPYFARANRAGGAMRVWIPTTVELRAEDIDDDPR